MDNQKVLFISYARVDKQNLIMSLVETLTESGYEIWFDHNLVPGQNWKEELLNQISRCDVFVYAMTPESIASENCQWEIKEASKLSKPIIPVKLQSNVQVPDFLKDTQWVDCSDGFTPRAIGKLNHGIREATTLIPEKVTNLSNNPTHTAIETGAQDVSPKTQTGETLGANELGRQIKKYVKQTTFPKLTMFVGDTAFLRLQKRKVEEQQLLVGTIHMTPQYIRRAMINLVTILYPTISREEKLTEIGWAMGEVTPDNKIIFSTSALWIRWGLPLKNPTSVAEILIESMRILLGAEEVLKSQIEITPRL